MRSSIHSPRLAPPTAAATPPTRAQATSPSWARAIERAGTGAIHPPPTFPAGDPASRLPQRPAAKLSRLREAEADLRAALLALSDEKQQHVHDRQRAEARLADLRRPGVSVAPDHPSVIEAQEARDAAAAAVAALDERAGRLAARQQRTAAELDEWLRRLPPGTPIAEHGEPAPPKLVRGELPLAALERVRRHIAELAQELEGVRSAPAPSAAFKARLREDVARLAQQGRPDVLRAVDLGVPVAFPTVGIQATLQAFAHTDGAPQVSGFATHTQPDALAVLCWLAGDAITEKLEREVDEVSDDGSALTDEERAAREADLLARTLEAEREEEALVELAEQGGTQVRRRPGADPRAVLGLGTDMPAPRA